MTEGMPLRQEDWGLDPRYRPAQKDSGIQIRFMGNTARVIGMDFIGQVDPYQMLAAADRMAVIARRMLELSDAKESAKRLQVVSSVPPEFRPR